MHRKRRWILRAMVVAGLSVGLSQAARAADPWADEVVSYDPGSTAHPDYVSDPGVVVGPPERFSGELTPFGPFPGVVSIFSPAFGLDEIISIGEGGHLTVRFDEPVVDDPSHPFGVDLIVFGNSFFAADFANFPDVTQLSPATLFDDDFALIEVSDDGVTFHPVAELADRLFPTQGYLDAGPFDTEPGAVPADFLRPVNPALTLDDFSGLSYAESLALYDGSGGGTPIDIGQTDLSSISYVRISVPDDGNPATGFKAEIDAFAAVPEPGTMLLLVAGLTGAVRRRRPRVLSRREGRGSSRIVLSGE